MKYKVLFALGLTAVLFIGQVNAIDTPDNRDESASTANAKFSETDTYLDLNTGKTFMFIYDGLNDIYNRSDLLSLDLFVNTRTKDTMWLEDAIVVNNALIRDAGGKYKIDPMKVKRNGSTFKVVQSTPSQQPIVSQ
jgi:hypothetical protein